MTSFSSVRVRLTVWNVCVVAFVLLLCGAAVRYVVEANLIAAVDRDLHRGTGRFLGGLHRHFERASDPRPPGRDHGPERDRGRFRGRDGDRGRPGGGPPSPMRVLGPGGTTDLEGRPVQPWDIDSFRRSLAGKEVFATTTSQGQRIRLISRPFVWDGSVKAVVQFAVPLEPTQQAVDQVTRTLFLLAPLALALAALGGAFQTGRALRPVRDITRAASDIQAENLSARLPVKGKDEFAQLTAVLNGMLERLEEALDRQKRFTGDASHELRTPLATIKATSSLAREDQWGAAQCQAALGTIEQAADRAGRIVDDLLLLARADSNRLFVTTAPMDVNQLLQQVVEEMAGPGRTDELPEVTLNLPAEPLQIEGDAHHLTRLFINLMENAFRHTPASGGVTVSARGEESYVVVTVADNGEGIAPEHIPHLGERFYRVDEARSRPRGGSGLGLAICKSIVEAHCGHMDIDSVLGEGTVVAVTLPRAA